MTPEVCDLFGWECPQSLYDEDPAERPSLPMVFVSGVDDSPLFDWNPQLLTSLEGELELHHVVLPGWSPTRQRAQALWQTLESLPPGEVNLVCWAVGGVDCRYLASPGGLFAMDPAAYDAVRGRVASVTTVATPHRGTNVADVLLTLPEGEYRQVIASGVLGSAESLDAAERDDRLQDVLSALTLDGMRTFNQRTPNGPGIHYQSFAGVSYAFGQTAFPSDGDIAFSCAAGDGHVAYDALPGTHDAMSDVLWTITPFAEVAVGRTGERVVSPSDGMIAVESARWGAFEGCVPADHYDVVGRTGHYGADPITGFNARGFLLHIARKLALVGL